MSILLHHYAWVLAMYAVGGALLGYAVSQGQLWLRIRRFRRAERQADPEVERITGGWDIADDPNRDWATGEDKIPAYSYQDEDPIPATASYHSPARSFLKDRFTPQGREYKSVLNSLVGDTTPRTPKQYALEAAPPPYLGRHSAERYSEAQVQHLNSGTAQYRLSPEWREAVLL